MKEMSGNTMTELKEALGYRREGRMDIDNESWVTEHDSGFTRLEQMCPFDKEILITRYRFKWALEKITGLSGNALDVGCSNGVLAHKLKEHGFVPHGIDVSNHSVEFCKKNVPGGTFIQGFADQKIDFPSNHFEVVTCLEVLEHVKDADKLVQELLRVTKPGGVLLATVPVGKAYDNPYHVRYFDFYALGKLFEPYVENFKICRIYKEDPQSDKIRQLWAIEVRK